MKLEKGNCQFQDSPTHETKTKADREGSIKLTSHY